MSDQMWWTLFEKTGSIDAYLLYKGVEISNKINDGETKNEIEKSEHTS